MNANSENYGRKNDGDKLKLSVIIPCYCSGPWIAELVDSIIDSIASLKISYEIILIDDCSPDGGLTASKLSEDFVTSHTK